MTHSCSALYTRPLPAPASVPGPYESPLTLRADLSSTISDISDIRAMLGQVINNVSVKMGSLDVEDNQVI